MDLVLEPNLKKFIFQPGRYPAVDAPYSDNCNSVVTNDITKKKLREPTWRSGVHSKNILFSNFPSPVQAAVGLTFFKI